MLTNSLNLRDVTNLWNFCSRHLYLGKIHNFYHFKRKKLINLNNNYFRFSTPFAIGKKWKINTIICGCGNKGFDLL